MSASLREYAQLHRRERFELARHAVATRPPPGSPTVPSQGVSPQPQGILHFQHLDRRVARVGHADVHARWPGRALARSLSPTDRLVVGPAAHLPTTPLPVTHCTLPAERDVVHGSLALRRYTDPAARERQKQRVDDALRRLDVASGDRARVARVDQTAVGRGDADGALHAAVRRDVFGEQRVHHEQHRRARHRQRAVDVPPHGRRGPREVGVKHTVADVDPHRDGHIHVIHAVPLEPVRGGETGGAESCQHFASASFGVVHQVAASPLHRGPAVTAGESPQAVRTALHRRSLRREVTAPRLGRAHVGEQDALHRRRERQRRHDHPLGEDLAGTGGHAAGLDSSDIRVVRPDHAVPADLTCYVDRTDEGDVGEV